jgi:DNA polymerase III sliding clamp (beta) subunit (PCNA family)
MTVTMEGDAQAYETVRRVAWIADDVERLEVAASNALVCASTDAARPVLTTVLVELVDGGTLRLVSTDSYVLAVQTLATADAEDVFPASILLERAGLEAVVKLCKAVRKPGRGTPIVTAETVEGGVVFAGDGQTVTVRSVDGDFPNWQQLDKVDAPAEAYPVVCLGRNRLAQLCKLRAPGTKGATNTGLAFRVELAETPLKPQRWTNTEGGQDLSVLVMPVRIA